MFNDEGEFYGQLTKLMQVTKVPVVLTASNSTFVSAHLLPLLRKTGVQFELIKYAVHKPPSCDLFAICMLIKLFEGPISLMLKNSEQLLALSS